MIRFFNIWPAAMIMLVAMVGDSAPVGAQDHPRPQAQSIQCPPVDSLLSTDAEVSEFVGHFNLIMVVTGDVQRDSVIRGSLTLNAWSPSISGLETEKIPWEVWGWSTLPVNRIGEIPLHTSVSADDPVRPGILGRHEGRPRKMTFYLGAVEPDGTSTAHAGLYLQVLATSNSGFRGDWGAGSLHRPTPSGHFCAWKRQ